MDFTIFTDASTQGWGAHMGDSQISGTPAPYQLLGTQGGRGCSTSLGPSASGPPGDDRYGQFNSSFLYQQTRRDSVPHLVTSGSGALYVVTSSEHSCPSKTHSRLSERDSRRTLLSQSADIGGTRVVDMFATVSNSHLPQFMSPILKPRALAVDALSQDWQGRSMYMFPPFPLLSKVIQKLWSTQEAEVILIAPLVAKTVIVSKPTSSLCGPSTVLSLPARFSVTTGSEIHLGRKVISSACMEALV